MNDLQLKLSADTKLEYLDIVSEFPEYRELMQRAVTILLLSNYKAFFVDDMPLYELFAKSNAVDSAILKAALNSMAPELKDKLEEDGEDLDSVELNLEVDGRGQRLTIDIALASGDNVTGDVLL